MKQERIHCFQFCSLNQNKPDGKALLINERVLTFIHLTCILFMETNDCCSNRQDAVCYASLKKYCNAWGHTAWNFLVKYGFLLSAVFIVVKQQCKLLYCQHGVCQVSSLNLHIFIINTKERNYLLYLCTNSSPSLLPQDTSINAGFIGRHTNTPSIT